MQIVRLKVENNNILIHPMIQNNIRNYWVPFPINVHSVLCRNEDQYKYSYPPAGPRQNSHYLNNHRVRAYKMQHPGLLRKMEQQESPEWGNWKLVRQGYNLYLHRFDISAHRRFGLHRNIFLREHQFDYT